jgi:hypothetical protein
MDKRQQESRRRSHHRDMLLSEAERERSFLFASQRPLPQHAARGAGENTGWTMSAGRGAATFLPVSSGALLPHPTSWGARPGSSTHRQQALILSRERLSPPPPMTAETDCGTARCEQQQSEANDNDKERPKRRLPHTDAETNYKEGEEGEEASSKATTTTTTTAASPRHTAVSVLDVTEETERERGLCPNGADCGSEDPFHFVLFRHTARDEFSVPASRADAFLFSSSSDALRRPLGGDEFLSFRQQPAGSSESGIEGLSAKRALLRRSVSDSGLKREIGLVDGRPTSNRGERSGWLHKRAPLLKVLCSVLVTTSQTKESQYSCRIGCATGLC